MNNYLFLFSISPVQSLISQARKTKDLYAGSKLLSGFIKNQIEKLQDIVKNLEIIFPSDLDSDSLPNRFVAKISVESEDEIYNIGRELKKNFKDILESKFNDSLKIKNENKGVYIEQILNTFETHWASVKLGDDYKKSYTELEKIHAAAKNIKKFKQITESGRKCSLCGERNAYFYGNYKLPAFIDKKLAVQISKNDDILFTKNETICAVCAIKRFYNSSFPSIAEITLKDTISEKIPYDAELFYDENLTENYFKKNNIPIEELPKIKEKRDKILINLNLKSSQLPKYYAVIMFDGDNMGKLLAGEKLKDISMLEDFHKNLSNALSNNAKRCKEIVDKYGKTVYAGGDDFLGFVTLRNLFNALNELNKTFKSCVNDKLQPYVNKARITMSAGIAIVHYKIPLKTVLSWAREMEHTAKENGRNSFAIAVLKHSGEIHKTVWKWNDGEISNTEHIEYILDKLVSKDFSTNFIHKLEEEFSRLSCKDNDFYDNQFETELKRLIKKSKLKDMAKIDDLFKICNSLYVQSDESAHNYFSLMRIMDFIARQLGGER